MVCGTNANVIRIDVGICSNGRHGAPNSIITGKSSYNGNIVQRGQRPLRLAVNLQRTLDVNVRVILQVWRESVTQELNRSIKRPVKSHRKSAEEFKDV